jgi:hypothetical protein
MKKPVLVMTLFFMWSSLPVFAGGAKELTLKTLKEYYKTGGLELVKQFEIGNDSLPEEVVLGSMGNFVITGKGNLFIVDIRRNNMKLYDPKGEFVRVIGQKGSGPGDLYLPGQTCYNGEYVIVWEIGNRRFSFFTQDGGYIKSVPYRKRGFMVQKIKALENREIILEVEQYNFGKDIGQERILKLFSADMTFKKDFYQQHVLTNKFISKPMSTNVPQPFSPLVSWDTTSKGKIVVGYEKDYKIDIYSADGVKQSSFSHKYQPVKVTEEDKKKHFSGITFMVSGDGKDSTSSKGAPDFIVENTVFPEYMPAFGAVIVDSEDNILVLPAQANSDEVFFDAFDSSGSFIGKVAFDREKIEPYHMIFNKSELWTFIKDEEEERKLVKYKITGGISKSGTK